MEGGEKKQIGHSAQRIMIHRSGLWREAFLADQMMEEAMQQNHK